MDFFIYTMLRFSYSSFCILVVFFDFPGRDNFFMDFFIYGFNIYGVDIWVVVDYIYGVYETI